MATMNTVSDTSNVNNNNKGNGEELVASTPNQRNWRGILIALLVIGCVCALIVFSVVLLTPPEEGPRVTGRRFGLEDVLGQDFDPPSFRGKWISDSEVAFLDDSGGISVVQVRTQVVSTLLTNFIYQRRLNVQEFEVSWNRRYVLLAHDIRKVHKYSRLAKYTALEVETQHVEFVTPSPGSQGHADLQLAVWVPSSLAIVMVFENDVYIKQSPSSPLVARITTTGRDGVFFNGVADFLYEHYILKQTRALWISSDGTMLCYAAFNDSAVHEVQLPIFTHDFATLNTIRYPKVDTPNPDATLWVVNIKHVLASFSASSSSSPSSSSPSSPSSSSPSSSSPSSSSSSSSSSTTTTEPTAAPVETSLPSVEAMDLKPPTRVRDQDHYFTDVSWLNMSTIAVVWRNRAHNVSVSTTCSAPLWYCEEVRVEESEPHRWVISKQVPLFAQNASKYVAIAPMVDRSTGSYPHVYWGTIDRSHDTPLTFGPYTVFSLLAWDVTNHQVYYVANTETDPGERHLWRVTDLTGNRPRDQECLTCGLNYTDPPCRSYQPYMGPDNFNEVVLHCEGPGVPTTVLYSLNEGDVLFLIHNNSNLQSLAASMAWPISRDYRVQLDQEFTATVRLTIPPELSEEEAIGHPAIVHVDASPGSQAVNHKWGVSWNTYLASNRSWVVLQMDVRGSGGQGLNLLYQPAWSLGSREAPDLLSVTRYLVTHLEYLDEERVAVYGWGHGGHNAARMMAADVDKLLSCSIAINPITDWKLYSSFYSEQYMGTARVVPGGNYRGYEDSSLVLMAEAFKNRSLLLVHGTADTDVHYSHTMRLVKTLASRGVIFRQQAYVDEGHDLFRVRRHLCRSLKRYLETECFPPYVDEELEGLFDD
ncbi:inactive dipeptidyl peptidase 10-like isoform X2 [Oratosquilla oratoria]|uniref:inactive dipeptidyl peptidase 10-like isoform X2 n=1 Tax=Oratosquilla oratoria TaxID=337810 RepID=UPI003F774AF6